MHPINYAKAELLAAGSALAQYAPILSAPIVGSSQEGRVPARWRHARRNDVDTLAKNDEIIEFPAHEASGRMPARYGRLALLSVRRHFVEQQITAFGGVRAVAYADKSELIVGTAVRGELFDVDPTDNERYIVGMRIGPGVLRASMGYLQDTGFFVPLVDKRSDGGVVLPDSTNVRFV